MNDVAAVDSEFVPYSERAAILLLSIGEENAAKLLRELGPKEVQLLGTEMAALTNLKRTRIASVFQSFVDEVMDTTGLGFGADGYVRSTLTRALGPDKAAGIIDRILLGGNTDGLDSLKWMDSQSIAEIIKLEHPQIQAIVMAYLDSELSAQVLEHFPEDVRLDALIRVAKLETVQPDALKELNNILEKQFSGTAANQKKRIGGKKVAADIMTCMDGTLEAQVMENLVETDEELATDIQDLMFVFGNLIDIDDRGIQTLLREVSTELLVVALKGADEELREKIFANMSSRAAELLRDDLEAMGPMKVSDVESAQKEIIGVARKLADQGDIMLGGSGEQML